MPSPASDRRDHPARELQWTFVAGVAPGSSSSDPAGMMISRPLRVLCGTGDPHLPQNELGSFALRVNRTEPPRSPRASSGTHLGAHRRWPQRRCPRPCDIANNGSSQTWRRVDALHSQPRDTGSFHGRASRSPLGVRPRASRTRLPALVQFCLSIESQKARVENAVALRLKLARSPTALPRASRDSSARRDR